jgi:hypothetical protein
MAASVTELALLSLPLPIPPALLSGLARAKTAMEAFSGQSFAYLLSSPSVTGTGATPQSAPEPRAGQGLGRQDMFIVGGWQSVRFHMEEWIPSEGNRELMEVLEGIEVKWMWHLGVERGVVEKRLFGGGVKEANEAGEEVKVRVWRGAVPLARVGEVEELLKGVREGGDVGRAGASGLDQEGLVSAWRLDDGYLPEEAAKQSFKRDGETEELVVLIRIDEEPGVGKIDEEVLVRLQKLVLAYEVRYCSMLGV